MRRRPPVPPLFPYTTLFRSGPVARVGGSEDGGGGLRCLADAPAHLRPSHRPLVDGELVAQGQVLQGDIAVSAAEEGRSEEHTSELQSHHDLVCRLLLEKKKE